MSAAMMFRHEKQRSAIANKIARPISPVLPVLLIMLTGCEGLVPRDTQSLFAPSFTRSEIVGFLGGLGTTFAAVPDLLTMLKRRSSANMNPRMAMIMGLFQVLWVYYGLLIASRPVIVWNVIAVLINLLCVAAYIYFARTEKTAQDPKRHS